MVEPSILGIGGTFEYILEEKICLLFYLNFRQKIKNYIYLYEGPQL